MKMNTQSDNNLEQNQDYIVQNVTPGHHCVSDIALNFGPFEIKDLTWENPMYVKRSNDLRKSLSLGVLVRISRKQFEEIEDRKIARERESLINQGKSRKMKTVVDQDGNQRLAESFDAASSYNKGEVDFSGHTNVRYANALDRARVQAEALGYTLDAEDFAHEVEKNPGYIDYILNGGSIGVASGDTRRGRAYFTEGAVSGDQTSVRSATMTNLNNDGYIAGDQNLNYSTDMDLDSLDSESGIAHEIDLTEEVPQQKQGKGAVRRKK